MNSVFLLNFLVNFRDWSDRANMKPFSPGNKMVSEWFLMSIEKITNGLLCGRIPGEWIHALCLSRTPVATGFRKAQGGDWSEQRHTKETFSS